MVAVVRPKCRIRSMIPNSMNPRNFTCSKCGEEFTLLPTKPGKNDLPAVWN